MRVGPFSAGRLVARLMLGTATLLLITMAAHADSMATYSVSGSNGFNSALSGTFNLDTTTNVLQDINLRAGTENLTVLEALSYANGTYSGILGPQTASFSISGGVLTLVTATGEYQGTIALSSPTAASSSSSTSTSPAPTPEPCSIVLLLTGLGGIAALARKNARAGRRTGAATALSPTTLQSAASIQTADCHAPQVPIVGTCLAQA